MKYRDKPVKDATTIQLVYEIRVREGVCEGPVKRQWGRAPVEVLFGIGKDHTGYITMDEEDYEALLDLVAET